MKAAKNLHTKPDLEHLLSERILVWDGAMGSMIQTHQLTEADFRGSAFEAHPGELRGCNDLLCLTQPHLIESIHRQYLEAGADIIETNTFNANPFSLEDYGLADRVAEVNLAAARLPPDGRRIFHAGQTAPSSRCHRPVHNYALALPRRKPPRLSHASL